MKWLKQWLCSFGSGHSMRDRKYIENKVAVEVTECEWCGKRE